MSKTVSRPFLPWLTMALLLVMPWCRDAVAQFLPGPSTASYLGGAYRQDFNALGNGTNLAPPGWYVANLTQGSVGTNYVNLSRQLAVGTGTSAPTGLPPGWNLGASDTHPDRSPGTGATGTGAPDAGQARAITLQMRNDSPAEIAMFSLYYDGEQWRTGSSGSPTNQLRLQFSRDGLNWTDLNTLNPAIQFDFATPVSGPAGVALNGKLPAHRRPGIGGVVTLDNTIEPGEVFQLRWFDYNEAGVDPLMAIDNLVFFAGENIFELNRPAPGESLIDGDPLLIQVVASADVTSVVYVVDSTPVGTNANPPFEWVVHGLGPGEHTVAVEGVSATGGVSVGPISITMRTNQPPSVSWVTSPQDLCLLAGTPVTNAIIASDSDGTISRIIWHLDGEPVFTTTSGLFIHESARPGRHTVTATVIDDRGAIAATDPATFSIVAPAPGIYALLVTNGSGWRYWNQAAAPPPDGDANRWYDLGYEDASWPAGLAPLGNGDDGEGRPRRTPLDLGPGLQRIPTLYFRTEFPAPATVNFTNLILRLLVDDGAVVYLNGVEIHRENLPPGDITHDTLAGNQPDDGRFFHTLHLDLVQGPWGNLLGAVNTLAVEVHQAGTTSTDLAFDLMLWGETTRTALVRQLSIAPGDPGTVVVGWDPYAAPDLHLEAADFLGWDPQATTWVPLPGCPGRVIVPLGEGFRAFRLAR